MAVTSIANKKVHHETTKDTKTRRHEKYGTINAEAAEHAETLDAAPLRGGTGIFDRARTTTNPQFVHARSNVPCTRPANAGRPRRAQTSAGRPRPLLRTLRALRLTSSTSAPVSIEACPTESPVALDVVSGPVLIQPERTTRRITGNRTPAGTRPPPVPPIRSTRADRRSAIAPGRQTGPGGAGSSRRATPTTRG